MGHELQPCIRCGRALRAPGGINVTGDAAIASYHELVSVGQRPRTRSKKKRLVICQPCGISLALGPKPDGAFNEAMHEMLVDMLRANPEMALIAVQQKLNPHEKPKLMPGSQRDKTLEMPVLKVPALQEVG
jgi:hypothetical protein